MGISADTGSNQGGKGVGGFGGNSGAGSTPGAGGSSGVRKNGNGNAGAAGHVIVEVI